MTLEDDVDELHRALHELGTKVDAALGFTRFVHWLNAWIQRRGWFA